MVEYGPTMTLPGNGADWALMLVDSMGAFDQIVTWENDESTYASGIDDTRWTFTPR